jgi:transposase
VVIVDNLRVHKREKAKSCLKEVGAWLLFLPSNSPDWDPTEMAFAKAHLKAAAARTFDALSNALGSICNLFTARNVETILAPQAMGSIKSRRL